MKKPRIRSGVRSRTAGSISRARNLRKASSFSEERLWENLRNHGIGYSFRRNHPMLTYWLDFYCPAAKLNIEVDGEQHDQTKARDARRDHELSVEGIYTVRFATLRVLSEMRVVLEEIQELCRKRTGVEPEFRNRD